MKSGTKIDRITLLLLFLFFPVGLFRLWCSKNASQNAKILVSFIYVFIIVCAALSLPSAKEQTYTPVDITQTYADVQGKTEYVINIGTNKIHLPECKYAKSISNESADVAYDLERAVAAGYIPCKACMKAQAQS